jgi:hypothetical protein
MASSVNEMTGHEMHEQFPDPGSGQAVCRRDTNPSKLWGPPKRFPTCCQGKGLFSRGFRKTIEVTNSWMYSSVP